MKVEIDLGEFDYEDEDYQASISEKIISIISTRVENRIIDALDMSLKDCVSESIKKVVDAKMPVVMNELLDHEFTEVTSWGNKKETYTVRSRILKAIEDQAVYKKTSSSFDRNAFTKMIDELVEVKLRDFRKVITAQVDQMFTKSALEYATKEVQRKLGIK